MATDLGQQNMVVVSGLARGIDTASHEGSLTTGTIAVIAGGVDVVYPRENTDLYKKICEQGAVVSECAWGVQPLAQHFPKRNRIVSGLSLGTVVIEANLRSGSLITARMAAEQGRDVMAVPGFPLDPRSEGTNALIRDGVTLVRDASDVMEQIGSFLKPKERGQQISFSEIIGLGDEGLSDIAANDCFSTENLYTLILPELSSTPVEVDEIVRVCKLRSADVQGTLLEMELEGVVQRLPGNRVCLVNG
jgi:DNA processing protein